MKIGILGCGNWGSVFGIMQHLNGHDVRIWEYDKERAQRVRSTRSNEPFLIGHTIPDNIQIHWEIENVVKHVDLLVFAIPSQVLRSVVQKLKKIDLDKSYYLSLTKGIEIGTLSRPSEIIEELAAAKDNLYVLSGPCIANEIIRKEPTAVVLVGADPKGTTLLQQELSTEYFRIYQSDDVIGVELGAATKNIIAIACGIIDSLGFGYNAKGALITRAIVEIQRFGTMLGARSRTFWGLSGFGDLVTTAFSEESRNHILGTKIGAGKNLTQAASEMVMVAEGAPTAKAVRELSIRYGVEMPICEAVYNILYKNETPREAIGNLMSRPLKNE
ncbi:MAG: NAD(P)-dependent glycerol-3-phosphate dehydrogenase [candidate division WOR-3 bacterium]|nr:MAG: NAD(P)-dependent glycerol-3-phosphate dehydrogenase [candidate division WOR-3 bacterium]